MKLTLGNLKAKVEGTPAELTWLDKYLSWEDPGAHRSPLFQSGEWDGRHRIFDQKTSSFPTGLSYGVLKASQRTGIPIVLDDTRIRPVVERREVPASWLRDYQAQAVRVCLDPHRPLHGRGVAQCPTGSGKTRIIASIAYTEPCVWLMVVDTKDLLDQGATAYEKLTGLPAGRIGDGQWKVEQFTVATMQTLLDKLSTTKGKDYLRSVQGLAIDEVHVAATRGYRKILSSTDAYWRLGFSATPLGREDHADLRMVGSVGPIVYKISPQQLIEKGLLVQPNITFVEGPEQPVPYWAPVELAKRRGGVEKAWPVAYSLGIATSESRNALLVKLAQKVAKPALLFVKAIMHGQHLVHRLEKVGLSVDYVHGADNRAARKSAIKRLEHGDLDVLVCSGIFNKGIDIPEVRGLINGAGGRSVHQAVQRLGRGTRTAEGKTEIEFWDVMDRGPWIRGHSKIRAKAYRDSGYVVKLTKEEDL